MKRTIIAIIYILLLGCQHKVSSEKELKAYISDPANGLKKEIALENNIKVSLTYYPKILLTKATGTGVGKNLIYFSLRLSRNHAQLLRQLDQRAYGNMLQVLSFRMQDYIKAFDEHDHAIQPADAYYQQTFGMTNYDELLFVFNSDQLLQAKRIRIGIDEFGLNLGSLDFEFLIENIKKVNNRSADMI